jgi:hypothetical protein
MTLRDRMNRLGTLFLLPAVVAHEYTHALFALVAGGSVDDVSLLPPRAQLRYRAGTPTLAIRLVNVAPTLVGLLLGLPLLLWAVSGPTSLPVAAYLLGLWAAYTAPSGDDLRPFAA